MQEQEKFDTWGIVDLFGHAKIAGRLSEQNVAGTNMLRVDVPETDKVPAFTRFLGSGAIYAINPTDEVTATAVASKLHIAPLQEWDINQVIQKNADHFSKVLHAQPALPGGEEEDEDFINDPEFD